MQEIFDESYFYFNEDTTYLSYYKHMSEKLLVYVTKKILPLVQSYNDKISSPVNLDRQDMKKLELFNQLLDKFYTKILYEIQIYGIINMEILDIFDCYKFKALVELRILVKLSKSENDEYIISIYEYLRGKF